MPPSATLPIYNNGSVYVKVLRLPKGTPVQFKNNDIFQKKKPKPPTTESIQSQNENNANIYPMYEEKPMQPNKQPKEANELKQPKVQNVPKFLIPQDIDFGVIGKDLQDGNGIPANITNNQSSTNQQQDNKLNNQTTKSPINQSQSSKTPIPENKGQQAFNEWDNIFNDINFNAKIDNHHSPKHSAFSSNKYCLENVFGDSNPQASTQTQQQPQTQQQSKSIPIHDLRVEKLMPIDRLPTNLAEDDLKERIDEIVKKWSMGLHERKNVLFLLSTLHEVWSNDPSWPGVSTQELVNNPKTLSSKFRLAKACLHPDKNTNKDFKTQYIASCLYQIFSEASDLYK